MQKLTESQLERIKEEANKDAVEDLKMWVGVFSVWSFLSFVCGFVLFLILSAYYVENFTLFAVSILYCGAGWIFIPSGLVFCWSKFVDSKVEKKLVELGYDQEARAGDLTLVDSKDGKNK
jgi:hypothetical protein